MDDGRPHPVVSDRLAVPGGSIWYEVHGNQGGIPVITIHGGPGYPHFYLQPLARLAASRPVVFYDQLGCGNSDRPMAVELWAVERFVDELAELIQRLGFSRVYLFGHSWGSIVAIEYVLRYRKGVSGLVLASPCLSIPRWIKDAERLKGTLPPVFRTALAGDEASPGYREATEEYYRRFVIGSPMRPPEVQQSDAGAGAMSYLTMWGPNEFTIRGTLLHYDVSDRLPELRIPTLVTCGRFDDATPETCAYFAGLLPQAKLKVFENSAHLPHLSESELFLVTVESFFLDID